jgi:hypothetical protein
MIAVVFGFIPTLSSHTDRNHKLTHHSTLLQPYSLRGQKIEYVAM